MTVLQFPQPKKLHSLPDCLIQARQLAREKNLLYAGQVEPEEAWQLFVSGQAHLVDVRPTQERQRHGHVPNTLNVPWQFNASSGKTGCFLAELTNKFDQEAVILLLCSYGKTSVCAAEAATQAGFKFVFSVSDGVEGGLCELRHLKTGRGWRQSGLPWVQG